MSRRPTEMPQDARHHAGGRRTAGTRLVEPPSRYPGEPAMNFFGWTVYDDFRERAQTLSDLAGAAPARLPRPGRWDRAGDRGRRLRHRHALPEAGSPWSKSSCIRRAMHPRRLRCSSLKYAQYSQSSRLAGAPRRPRCSTQFPIGPLWRARSGTPRSRPCPRTRADSVPHVRAGTQ